LKLRVNKWDQNVKNKLKFKEVPLTHQPLIGNMAGEIDNSDEIEETDRPQISSGYFNQEGDRISKIPPSVSKKGLLKSSLRETKYSGESEASRKRCTGELSTLLVSMSTS
jgi:hypothetical protein